jgi:hypothetical protein
MVRQIEAGSGTDRGVVALVAAKLGINRETLRLWVRQARIDAGARPGTSSEDVGWAMDRHRPGCLGATLPATSRLSVHQTGEGATMFAKFMFGKSTRVNRPRRAAWWVALTVLAVGTAVLPAAPAAAGPLNVSLTPVGGLFGTGLWAGQSTTLTASADVALNANFISLRIDDQTAQQTVNQCNGAPFGQQFTCSAVVSQNVATSHTYIAYVTEFTPGPVFDQSYTITVSWDMDQVYLDTVNLQNTNAPGVVITLSAHSYVPVGPPSPYFLEIFDLTAGNLIASCGGAGDTTCSTQIVQLVPTTHVYRAYVTPFTNVPPVNGTYWQSFDSYFTWNNSGESLLLYINESNDFRLNATAPFFPPPGYDIDIFAESTGMLVATCPATVLLCGYGGGDASLPQGYVAFIDPVTVNNFPPANFLASSDTRQTGPPTPPL